MPRSKKKSPWGKRATFTAVVLGLVASIPMNLLSGWLQEINIAYLVLIFLLALGIMYSGWKLRTPDWLNNIFWLFLATVSINLFSTWVQSSLLQNNFTLPTITVLLAATVILLAIGALFQSHYYRRKKQSVMGQYRWNAKNIRLAKERSENPELQMKVTRRLPSQRKTKQNVKRNIK